MDSPCASCTYYSFTTHNKTLYKQCDYTFRVKIAGSCHTRFVFIVLLPLYHISITIFSILHLLFRFLISFCILANGTEARTRFFLEVSVVFKPFFVVSVNVFVNVGPHRCTHRWSADIIQVNSVSFPFHGRSICVSPKNINFLIRKTISNNR